MPTLAIIIPTLDEAEQLPRLLEELAAQQGLEELRLEILVADGGSRDGTRRAFDTATSGYPFPIRWLDAPRGRARQMNAAARQTEAQELFFLHADSRIDDPHLLARGYAQMASAREAAGHDRVAGHFGLRFFDRGQNHPLAYYFYEAKPHLNRPDCISGDQGQWLSRAYFLQLGTFDYRLPYLEDSRLAAAVFRTGTWITLPGELQTSARRLEVEGFAPRQTLNALIRCFDEIGFHRFLREAAGIYADQSGTGQLDLGPFLALAHRLSVRGGWTGWLRWWYLTGKYVRDNAWHLAFAWDCRRNLRREIQPGEGATSIMARFEKIFNPLTDNPMGRAATMVVTLVWFNLLRARLALAAPAPRPTTR